MAFIAHELILLESPEKSISSTDQMLLFTEDGKDKLMLSRPAFDMPIFDFVSEKKVTDNVKKNIQNVRAVDIYVVSDSTLLNGDFFIEDNKVKTWNSKGFSFGKKVFATTSTTVIGNAKFFPKINKDFLLYFIEKFNSGNQITITAVECDEKTLYTLNNLSNEIKIVDPMPIYGIQDLILIASKAYFEGYNTCLGSSNLLELSEWFVEELKKLKI